MTHRPKLTIYIYLDVIENVSRIIIAPLEHLNLPVHVNRHTHTFDFDKSIN